MDKGEDMSSRLVNLVVDWDFDIIKTIYIFRVRM